MLRHISTYMEREKITYYGKEIIIPNIDDMILIRGISDTIIIIVDKVVKEKGRKGLYFSGYLHVSIINPGAITHIDLQSRNLSSIYSIDDRRIKDIKFIRKLKMDPQ